MEAMIQSHSHLPSPPSSQLSRSSIDSLQTLLTSEEVEGGRKRAGEKEEEEEVSRFALLMNVIRKSLAHCRREGEEDLHRSMEIGWPIDVRHVAHVTFDRFHGFLGLPVEFEPEVPRRALSASANVFGVSAESMQCCYDSRGNSVPSILLLMQRHLYERGGLQAEGIFRINAGNNQEEYARDLLKSGTLPDRVDVHCLASLIKAWFRELPAGVLDTLTPEQVMQCQSEEECVRVVRLLPPTEAALLDWAINLMADVVQDEQTNKMNEHNIATVFAPNMTQMADPSTALIYVVQVMNFLKMLIHKTLVARQQFTIEVASISQSNPSDENDHNSSQLSSEDRNMETIEHVFLSKEPTSDDLTQLHEENSSMSEETTHCTDENLCEIPILSSPIVHLNSWRALKGISILSHINSEMVRIEAWR